MNRRALVVMLLVIVLGGILFLVYQRRYQQEAAGGEMIKVLVATKSIERDKSITDDMLATREIPQAYVEDRAIKEVEKPKIIGLKTDNYVHVGQSILWTDLVSQEEEKHDLSSFVQAGNRAVNVRLGDDSGTLIHSGDYVDIISLVKEPGRPNPKGAEKAAAMPLPKPGEPIDLLQLLTLAQQRGPTDQDAKAAVVLLQRVLVLAVDSRGPNVTVDVEVNGKRGSSGDGHGTLLTLSLTLPEAQLLALAAEKGVIAVAVRNRDDQRVVERIPDVTSAALLEPGVREALRGYRHGGTLSPTAPAPAAATAPAQ